SPVGAALSQSPGKAGLGDDDIVLVRNVLVSQISRTWGARRIGLYLTGAVKQIKAADIRLKPLLHGRVLRMPVARIWVAGGGSAQDQAVVVHRIGHHRDTNLSQARQAVC